MHNAAFAANKIDGAYVPLLVNELPEFLERIVRPGTQELDWNIRGFSVTIPHKVAILHLMNRLTDTARAVGAVNTVTVEGNNFIGDNTDVKGALVPLERITSLQEERVGVIGAGGAARAVIYGLKQAGSDVIIFGRRPEAAAKLADEFKAKSNGWENLGKDSFDIVINTTPIGMKGYATENAIPDSAVTNCRIFYDLVYNPVETKMMKTAAAAGVQVLGGLEMLVAQGAEQFKLWTGQDAPREVIMAAALKQLTSLNQDFVS
jgi:3-dehydroquinate dehydratase/shikimate dehydrogenase